MKKYIFNLSGEELPIVIIAKNLQSATTKLQDGGFYTEDQINSIEIVKK